MFIGRRASADNVNQRDRPMSSTSHMLLWNGRISIAMGSSVQRRNAKDIEDCLQLRLHHAATLASR